MANSLIGNSFILEHLEYFLPLILIFVAVFYFYQNKNEISTQLKNTELDGAEYIGTDFPGNNINEFENDEEFTPSLEDKVHIPFAGATITLQNGGAERFYEIVNNRRSVRHFSSRSVPFHIIEKCIASAGTAPSGAHTEPWTFCVIDNKEMKEKIREIIETEEYTNYTQRMHRQWTSDLRPLKTNHVKEYLTDAPYLILIFKQIYGLRTNGQKKQHYYNEISVAISTGILLCALQAEGLNSLVTTPLNCGPALRLLLNRPKNEKLLVLLPVGYAAEDCKVPDLKRKDVNEILVRY